MDRDTAARERATILVVDDVEANVDLLVELLSEEYDVAVALDGPSALEAAREERPDLVLLDIMMPGMDGHEVLRRLRTEEATANLPVIFVTAKGEAHDEALGFDLGAVDYVTKPISPPRLFARIRAHLALREALLLLEEQNRELLEAAELREDVERITRHDLKNPLTDVLSLPQLMLMADNLDEHQRDMLGRIEEAGRTMLEQINRSLDLFKIERGTYVLDPAEVDLARLVRRVFRQFSETAASADKDLLLMVDGREDDGEAAFVVRGEELLLQSMLAGLVRNALEASPQGSRVLVELRSGMREAVLAVSNRGAVPEAVRDSFFEKYATSGKARGTGLGTYSARLVAEVHGGGIGFSTSEAQGTTVTVRLPG